MYSPLAYRKQESNMRIFLVRHGESMGNVDRAVHLTMADHAIPPVP